MLRGDNGERLPTPKREPKRGGLQETRGDLWAAPGDLLVITTNGDVNQQGLAVMGRGCAKEAAQRYPRLPAHFGRLLATHGNRVMRIGQQLPRDGEGAGLPPFDLASFPVKHHWHETADLELICQSAEQLVALADKFGYTRIILPRPGCGNGGLRWAQVGPFLHLFLDGRFTVISFPPKDPKET